MNNHLKYRIKSYLEYHSKSIKRASLVVGIIIFSQILGVIIYPFRVKRDDTSFMKTADTIEIRYDAKFEIEKKHTTGDRIEPLSKEYISFTVPAEELYGGNEVKIIINGSNRVKRVRSKVIAELDFYEDGKYTGTIELVTPRDMEAYEDVLNELKVGHWEEINGKRVLFHKGSRFFKFIQKEVLVSTDKIPSIEENLETIIQNHLDAQ